MDRTFWHATDMILRWIREIAETPPVIDPATREVEVRENTWALSRSSEEFAAPSVAEIVSALEECATARRGQIQHMQYIGPVTFYVWHDLQAGQLRCSTASTSKEFLPFHRPIDLNVSLVRIVEKFLLDINPGKIPWSDLRDVEQGAPDPVESAVTLQVWTSAVGSTT